MYLFSEVLCRSLVPNPGLIIEPYSVLSHRPGDMITFRCVVGYRLKGAESLTCKPNGKWNGELPFCKTVKCGQPPEIDNADLVKGAKKSSYGVNEMLKFQCYTGFYTNTSTQKVYTTCTPLGSWSTNNQRCDPITCETYIKPSHMIQNEILQGDGSTYGSIVVHICESGYEAEATIPLLACTAIGTWNGTLPRCQAIQCTQLVSLVNGEAIVNSNTFGNKVALRCNIGYELLGEDTVRCLANKSWSYSNAQCKSVSCGTPPEIEHAIWELGSHLFNSTLQLSCERGYTVQGSPNTSCDAFGEWIPKMNTICKAVNCPTPRASKNTQMRPLTNTYEFGNRIMFMCKSGYRLSTEHDVIYCTDNGTWDNNAPTCTQILCPPIVSIDQGIVIGNNTPGSVVKYKCQLGHKLAGSATRECQTNGTWSVESPVCRKINCPKPKKPPNGKVSPTDLTYGSQIVYGCDYGFELRGSKKRRCGSSKTWSGRPPTCQQIRCRRPKPNLHGYHLGTNYSMDNNITWFCDNGFTLRGHDIQTCQRNKKWTGTYPNCERNHCDLLSDIENGSILVNNNMFNDTVVFTCDIGYQMMGSSHLFCQASSQWNGSVPICIRKSCPQPRVIKHASISGNIYKYNFNITYRCDTGYELVGEATRVCQDDGSWGGDADPACIIITCKVPQPTSNLNIQVSGDTYGSTLAYYCERGYLLSGIQTDRTCGPDRQWSGDPSSCIPISCGSPPTINNGYSVEQNAVYGEIVHYQCNYGYAYVPGAQTYINCTHTGAYTTELPMCLQSFCRVPNQLANGNVITSTNIVNKSDIIEYVCDLGYRLQGDAYAVCRLGGKWDNINIGCLPVQCSTPESIVYGGYTLDNHTTDYESHVTYRCDYGYELVGSENLYCTEIGQWSGMSPTCSRIECPNVTILNGKVIVDDDSGTGTYIINTNITLSCNEGFIATINNSVCASSGVWVPPISLDICQAIECRPHVIPHSVSYSGVHSFSDIVPVACEIGYELHGNVNITCGSNGEWEVPLPECKGIECDALQLDHGRVSYSFTNADNKIYHGSEASFRCNTGYNLIGRESSSCLSTGQWSTALPQCIIVTCTAPTLSAHMAQPNAMEVLYRYNDEVSYKCELGYDIIGETSIVCTSNGSWSSTPPSCSIILCDVVRVDNGIIYNRNRVIIGDSVIVGTIVTTTCITGYVVATNYTTVECGIDGQLSQTQPYCRPVRCPTPVIENGVWLSMNETVGFAYDSVVTFTCRDGYKLENNPDSLTCMNTEEWSDKYPICREITCDLPITPVSSPLMIPKNDIGHKKFNDSITFSCPIGFKMQGPVKVKCVDMHIWHPSSVPECILIACVTPILQHGYVLSNNSSSLIRTGSIQFGAYISFRCIHGYQLIGLRYAQCLANESWSNIPKCTMIICEPIIVSNASVLYSERNGTHAFGSESHIECHKGFKLIGKQSGNCHYQGLWTNRRSVCQHVSCDVPAISHANINVTHPRAVINMISYGDYISVECHYGYDLLGIGSLRCQEDGNWSHNDTRCEPVTCSPFIQRDHLHVTPDANQIFFGSNGMYSLGSLMHYSCDIGYRLNGSSTTVCQASSEWSRSDSSCLIVQCPHPPTVSHANMVMSSSSYLGTATYTCDSGYQMITNHVLACTEEGSWFGETPRCARLSCPPLSPPNHGSIAHAGFLFNDTVSYECDSGYILRGPHHRTCLSDQSWTSVAPVCVLTDCGLPRKIAHGSVTYEGTTYKSAARYSCNTGYTIHGAILHRCDAEGEWTGGEIRCMKMACVPPGNIANGDIVGSKRYTHGENVTYNCNEGFILHGKETRQCLSVGTWSDQPPSCTEAMCPHPPDYRERGYLVGDDYGPNGTITINCNQGYRRVGHHILTCIDGIQWDLEFPVCKLIVCRSNPTLAHASFTNLSATNKPGTVLPFTCESGYKINGTGVVTCGEDGSWITDQGYCARIVCEVPSIDATKLIIINTAHQYRRGSIIYFTCKPPYKIKRQSYMKCNEDGHWLGRRPQCIKQHCPAPRIVNYATNIKANVNDLHQRIEYHCNMGYILQGSSEGVCYHMEGKWIYNAGPTRCAPRDCGKPAMVPHASIYQPIQSTTYGATLLYKCADTHDLIGNSEATCNVDGQWEPLPPYCLLMRCEAPVVPEHGFVVGDDFYIGASIVFLCDDGYEQIGAIFSQCMHDGRWSGEDTICNRKHSPSFIYSLKIQQLSFTSCNCSYD